MSNRLVPHLLNLLEFRRPPPVVEWLEANIKLPELMAPRQSGPFRVKERPQMAPILECFHPAAEVRNLTVAAGSQWGKTTIGALGHCYLIKWAPGPALIFAPSEEWIKNEISKKRLRPLIEENHELKLEMPYNRDDFQNLHMAMNGMPIDLVGANSSTALAGSTRRYVWGEEASKIEHTDREDAPEAHPIKNAFERTKEFAGMDLHYLSSTPNSPQHIFWQSFLAGDQTTFPLECPHCRNYFPLEWVFELNRDQMPAEFFGKAPSDYVSMRWDQAARKAGGEWDENAVRASARMICPHEGCEINDDDKARMLPRFEQHHANPNAAKGNRSFRIPSFYSPRVTLGDMALKFLDRGDLFTTGLQTFYNSWLALPWEEVAANVKDEHVRRLADIAQHRRHFIERPPYRLVLCADVGDYKTHWICGAIFDNDETAVIDWGTVLVPEDLLALPEKLKYTVATTGEVISPYQGLVDAKDQTVRVYDMCQRSRGFWFPSSGSDTRSGTWGFTPLKTHRLDLYTFNTFQFKRELYIDLILGRRAPRFSIPRDADEELIHGLSGQQLIKTNGKDEFKKIAWDHYGDCCIRLQLARLILRAERGHGAPDMAGEIPAPGAGRDYTLRPA